LFELGFVGTNDDCKIFAPASSARFSFTFLLDKVFPALNDAAIQSFAAATQSLLSDSPREFSLPVVTLVKSTTTNTAIHKNIIATYFTYNVTASVVIPIFKPAPNFPDFPDDQLETLYNGYANPTFLFNVMNMIMDKKPTDPILANLANAIIDTNSFDDYLDPAGPADEPAASKKVDLAIPLGVGLGLPLGIFLVVGVLYYMHKNNMLGDNSSKPPSKGVEMSSAGHHVQVATGDNHGRMNEI